MLRITVFVLSVAFSVAAHGQAATNWVSAQWRPMAEENARGFQQADAGFKAAVEADYQARVEAAKAPVKPTHQAAPLDKSVLVPGGATKELVPRGSRKPQPPAITSIQQLLPAGLEFAAPSDAGLIVQRMSGSVLFGRSDSDEVVVVPLSGEADLPHGMRGSIREEGKQLRLVVQLPAGEVVEYRYSEDPETPGLRVDVSILGALPGKNVDFARRYRRAQVNVGELRK
jgi:hypothetical protein